MLTALRVMWPLMFGYYLLMLGHGLHSTLLGIRAKVENFDPTLTGFIISFYTVGMIIGTFGCGKLIERIGHIRAFAVAAAATSGAALLYVAIVHPVTWAASRIIIGLAMAMVYTATESWINDSAENHNRGSYLSLYMIVTNLAMGFGQFLLLLAPVESPLLFLLISFLWSFSVIPILLTVRNVPRFEAPKSMKISRMFDITPFGVVNMILIGIVYSSMFIMAGVFASEIGFTIFETSLFVSVLIFVPALTQTPWGKLSDQYDRRVVILIALALGLIICGLTLAFPEMNNVTRIVMIGVFAGCIIPVHSLVIAHTNDFMQRDEMVAASSGMIRLFALGSALSPPVTGFFMTSFGAVGYYYFLGIGIMGMIAFSVHRIFIRRGRVDTEFETKFQSIPRTQGSTLGAVLHPEAESEELGYTYIEEEPTK